MTSGSFAYDVPGFYEVQQADLVAWVSRMNCMYPIQELKFERHKLASSKNEK